MKRVKKKAIITKAPTNTSFEYQDEIGNDQTELIIEVSSSIYITVSMTDLLTKYMIANKFRMFIEELKKEYSK